MASQLSQGSGELCHALLADDHVQESERPSAPRRRMWQIVVLCSMACSVAIVCLCELADNSPWAGQHLVLPTFPNVELSSSSSSSALLTGVGIGIVLGICITVIFPRLSRWPNSYIADGATLDETSSLGRLGVRAKMFVGVVSPTPAHPAEVPRQERRVSLERSASAGKRSSVDRRCSVQSFQSCLDRCVTEDAAADKWFSIDEDVEDLLKAIPEGKAPGLSTMRRLSTTNAPSASEERQPMWSPGTGTGLSMRCGPDHRTTKSKQPSTGHMYECISVDVLKADQKIEEIMDKVMPVPSYQQIGSGSIGWTSSCPLPRIVCVNTQLPYKGLNPWGSDDPGCSVVSVFHITGETLQQLEDPNCSAPIKLFKDFVAGPCGRLSDREINSDKTGVLKAVAYCTNVETITENLWAAQAATVKNFNGKPCLITKSGSIRKGPDGEYIELSVDVRLFASAARVMLQQCCDRIALASLHVGFSIQGIEDDELPEGLIGDAVIHNLHIVDDAQDVAEGAGGQGGLKRTLGA